MPGQTTLVSLHSHGADVSKLHAALTKLGLTVPRHEADAQQFGVGTRDVLLAFQQQHGLTVTGALDEATQAALDKTAADAADGKCSVEGRILTESGVAASGLALRLYDRGIAGRETKLGESKTDENGYYAISYAAPAQVANLELRAVDRQSKEVALSATKYGAAQHEVLNLVAPESLQPRAAEYQQLIQDLATPLGTGSKLADAREEANRRDFTILGQATGWDARLIALAATAQRLEAETGVPHDALYALLRTGLPMDKEQLAHVSADAVAKALAKAQEAGIVGLSEQQLAAAKTAFDKFARKTRLAAKAPGAASTFEDLLKLTGLNTQQCPILEDLFFTHRGTPAEFWQKAKDSGIAAQTVEKLKLQGKLAHMTHNNVPLMAKLQDDLGAAGDLSGLVDKDLDRAESWQATIKGLAAGNEQALAALIPPAYAGATTADRLTAYAADLARQVRLSFPTRVVARMVEKGELRLAGADGTAQSDVRAFLGNAEPLGFALGKTPISTFTKDAEARTKAFRGIPPERVTATTQAVKKLQRLYQITPSNEALQAVSDLGFGSAHEIASMPCDVFLERFGKSFGQSALSLHEAQLTYRKAQQVSAVTYSFFATIPQVSGAPAVYAVSPTTEQRQTALQNIAARYPTMETLFGSLDFCECEQCRSVLSPAAYLVDLLQFLDPASTNWDATVADWNTKHPGQTYSAKHKKPIDALLGRRPDLAHLPLTCENTNTVLPYIDVVNEILEYYVAHGQLTAESAHDTGATTSAELLAEPQNVLSEAYVTLKGARYPLGLPFDLWIETVRRLLDHFETPFSELLETLRKNEDLFVTPGDPGSYGQAAVLAEQLRMAPVEYDVLTNPQRHSAWHELYGFGDRNNALHELNASGDPLGLQSAQTLARRLAVSYEDLTEIVCTGFANPQLDALTVLRKLNVDARDAFRYRDLTAQAEKTHEDQLFLQAFEARLAELTAAFAEAGFDAKAWLQTALGRGDLNKIVVLADPDTGCSFADTILRYADATDAEDVVFLKLNLFVRLWKKLGWTIEETDRALQALLPASSLPLTLANVGDALKTALVYIAHLKSLGERLAVGRGTRVKLLALWSNLATTGKNPLYAQLFLTQGVLKIDGTFDHPLGQYLSKPHVYMKDHLLALQAALKLTADEVAAILADAGNTLETAPLSLDTVSRLYRHGLLAKALKLTVREVLVLKSLSGIDPFTPIEPNPITKSTEDHPAEQTLRFVEMVEKIRASGFSVADLDYLLRHAFDPVGPYRRDPSVPAILVKTVAAGLRQIQAEHPLPSRDTDPPTEERLRQELALVLPAEAVETFFKMWNATVEYTASVPATQEELGSATFADDPDIQVSFDGVRKEQRLVFTGVLPDARKTQICAAHPSAILAALLDDVQVQIRSFYEAHSIGFADYEKFVALFASRPQKADDPTQTNDPEVDQWSRARRDTLADAFLPFLHGRLARQLIVQTLTGLLGGEPTLVEALLTDARLLRDRRQPDQSLLDALLAARDNGLTASFYSSLDATGEPAAVTLSKSADTEDNKEKPALAQSACLAGWIEVSTTGAYRFYVTLAKKDAEAELGFLHLPDPIIRYTAAKDGDEASEFVELTAGVPYRVALTLRHLGGGDARLLVQGPSLPKGALDRLTLYPASVVEAAGRAHVLLSKALQITAGFKLTERELRHILTHAPDFSGIDLGQLPADADDASAATATTLFGQFLRLADYVQLRDELAGGTDDLITIFGNARRTFPASADPTQAKAELLADLSVRLAALTRREASAVLSVAVRLGIGAQTTPADGSLLVQAPAFAQAKDLRRLWAVLTLAEKLGVSVEALARWAVPAPDQMIAQDLKNTLKACYDTQTWQRVSQSIFDTLRQRRRDALVAYLLEKLELPNIDYLYQHFLVDPGTEPVVQTSRLRLAISSVQLFIQRCLLNLEQAEVPASVISAKRWEWMKRYRVWEANRKILLFPENWLEPEFRDDKSHLFKELESALLQGDVTRDTVEDAFFQYLKQLEEIARLEIVAMYCEERPPDWASNTLHVLGRTANSPHKYFYRRYANQMWTPWEPVPLEIESDVLAIAVWRERVHLFWVTPFEKPEEADGNGSNLNFSALAAKTPSELKARRIVELQLNWSELYQGQWTTRTSSGFGAPMRILAGDEFDIGQTFIHVAKECVDGEERGLRVHLHFKWASAVAQPGFLPELGVAATARQVGGEDSGGVAVLSVGDMHLTESSIGQGFECELVSATPGQLATGGMGRLPAASAGIRSIALDQAFRVISQNSPPRVLPGEGPRAQPYPLTGNRAGCYTGAGALQVRYDESIVKENGDVSAATTTIDPILGKGSDYTLLFSANPTAYPPSEIAPLVSPFFYQDDDYAFFVEPWLTEVTLEKWEGWALKPAQVGLEFERDDFWQSLSLFPEAASQKVVAQIDASALYQLRSAEDWLTNPATILLVGNRLIGSSGGLDQTSISAATSSRTGSAGGLSLVSANGLNSAVLRNVRRG